MSWVVMVYGEEQLEVCKDGAAVYRGRWLKFRPERL